MSAPLNGVEIVEFFPQLDSTNREAAARMRAGATEGLIILTDYQYAGRGQRGADWVVEPGANLTFSAVLRPSFLQAAQLFRLNQVAALAVADLLEQFCPAREVRVKWPNDLLLGGRKVCGILVESQLEGARVSGSVAGIGLNVNQISFPDDLRFPATSLRLHTGRAFDVEAVFGSLRTCLWRRYATACYHPGQLEADYLARLFGLNVPLFAEVGAEKGWVVVRGIDAYGRLRADWKGRAYVFDVREIRIFPPNN